MAALMQLVAGTLQGICCMPAGTGSAWGAARSCSPIAKCRFSCPWKGSRKRGFPLAMDPSWRVLHSKASGPLMLLTPAEDREGKKKPNQNHKMVFPHSRWHVETRRELPIGKKSLRGMGEVPGEQRALWGPISCSGCICRGRKGRTPRG